MLFIILAIECIGQATRKEADLNMVSFLKTSYKEACMQWLFGVSAQDNHKGIEPEHGFLFEDKL